MPVDYTPCCASVFLWVIGVYIIYRRVEKALSAPKYANKTWYNAETPAVPVFWTTLGAIVWGAILLALAWVYEWLLGRA